MKDINCRPAIGTRVGDMDLYDTVFIGFPIWWYREPSIIDTFMYACCFNGKTVIPFATSVGSGLGDSAKNMQELAKGAKVESGRCFIGGVSEDELKEWANHCI